MDTAAQIQLISEMAHALLAEQPAHFLVQVRIKPTNNVKVFIDGDQGVTIEDCIRLNRKLYAQLEEKGLYPEGDFSLEVSSPGVGEPLLLQRQYLKNIGRLLEVKTTEGVVLTGILQSADDNGITLAVSSGKGKKAVTQEHQLLFDNIKEASVQIQF
jgi:ribosome maturation factor RimP